MTKSATSEAISRSWRAISSRATKKVLTLAKPRPEPRRSSMARRSKTWTRGAENWGNSPSRLSGGSRLQSFLSAFFGATHLLPVIFIFCELVLWIFFYLKSKRLFTFNGSNLHLIINFTMLIWNFPCNCIHYSVSIVCFVQSAFCCTFWIEIGDLLISQF